MEIAEVITRDVLEDFTSVKNQYKVPDDKFRLGMEFCVRVSSGESRTRTWMELYGERGNPSRDSAKFMRAGWVNAILMKMRVGNNLNHLETRSRILARMSEIALDHGATHKASIDAAKVFLDSTSMPEELHEDVTMDFSEETKEAMAAFLGTMAAIASGNAPMIGRDGKFIQDAELVIE